MEVYPYPEIGWWKYWAVFWLFIIISFGSG
jgi:hypothetical protein